MLVSLAVKPQQLVRNLHNIPSNNLLHYAVKQRTFFNSGVEVGAMKRNVDFLVTQGFMKDKKLKIRSMDDKIKEYIAENGFGSPTEPLTKNLSADVFRQHYYTKKELIDFCNSIGIPTIGLKNDLNDRIDTYLRTKKIPDVKISKNTGRSDSELGLALNKPVINYKSDPVTRRFMERNVPGFTGFSALVQKWIKEQLAEGESITYGDVVTKHKLFLSEKNSAKASGLATTVAHDSCQFNQFYIDYSHDSEPKVHTAKEAWELVRDTAGAKTYARYQQRIAEITSALSEETPGPSESAKIK
jgi:hypothetical protein